MLQYRKANYGIIVPAIKIVAFLTVFQIQGKCPLLGGSTLCVPRLREPCDAEIASDSNQHGSQSRGTRIFSQTGQGQTR